MESWNYAEDFLNTNKESENLTFPLIEFLILDYNRFLEYQEYNSKIRFQVFERSSFNYKGLAYLFCKLGVKEILL